MQHAIQTLQQEANAIKERMNAGGNREECLRMIADIQLAIGWLSRLQELEVARVRDYTFTLLPELPDAYAQYRLVNDYDSNLPTDWREVEGDLSISGGDLLISRKA